MPIYEYRCPTCGKLAEQFNCMDNHKNGPICCGEVMRQKLGSYYVHGDFQPYVDHNMADKPVVVKSKQHRKQLMKEHNVTESVGKGWV